MLAAAVLTPRHTPPHAAEQGDVPAPGDLGGDQYSAGNVHVEVTGLPHQQQQDHVDMLPRVAAGDGAAAASSRDALPSSQSTLPHHSQYSQLPSPFVRDLSLGLDSDDSGLPGAGSGVDASLKIEEDSDGDLELLVSRADPIKIPIDDDGEGLIGGDGDWHMWNELAPAEHQVIQDLHAVVAEIQQAFQRGPSQTPGASTGHVSQAPSAAVGPAPTSLPMPPQQHRPQAEPVAARESSSTHSSIAETAVPKQPQAVSQDLQSVRADGGLAATRAAYLLNSPPRKKRQRERSSSADEAELVDRDAARHTPSPKRQKLNPLPGQSAHSGPPGLHRLQRDSPVPTPGRRVPRASLAANSQVASESPASAPPPIAEPAPPQEGRRPSEASVARGVTAERDVSSPSQAIAQPQPVSTSASNIAAGIRGASEGRHGHAAAAKGPRLKDLVTTFARKYGVPERTVTNLMFCTCAKCDETFEDVIQWFAPAHRPLEGTPDHERLARLVSKSVWTLREDTIALEGSERAVAQLEAKRGKHAIQRRVAFLGRAQIKNVASLRKDLYVF